MEGEPLGNFGQGVCVKKRVIKILLALLWVLVCLVGYVAIRVWRNPQAPSSSFYECPRCMVFSHQGGEGLWPTNTMYAYEQSQRLGVDVLDLDVQYTSRGEFYVIHDDKVDRTTEGSGRLEDLPHDKIVQLDAGYRFSTDGKTFPFRGKGLRIPTLSEVLQKYPHTKLGIELKTHSAPAAVALAEYLRRFKRRDDVLVSCFNDQALRAFRRVCPELPTSAGTSEIRNFIVLNKMGLSAVIEPPYSSIQIPVERDGWRLLDSQVVEAAHRKGVRVIPWTINEPAQMKMLLDWKVDGINTNFPDRLLEVCKP